MAGGLRVSLAFGEDTLAPSPTWTDITATANLVAGATIDRGRAFELDRTETGTAEVSINDIEGVLDPTNSSSPYYGELEPLLQCKLDLWNPVTATFKTIYRGFVEDFDFGIDPSQRVQRLRLSLVDLFEILTAIEMQPGYFGDTVPPGAEGNIFFDNANVDDRIIQVYGNAGIPSAMYVVFSGNVALKEAVYSPGDSVLQVVQDCGDSEFPGVSNVFCEASGRIVFHGRKARFDPVTTAAGASPGAWDFTHWKSGDGAAVVLSPSDTAQIRVLSWNRGLSKVINQAFSTPNGIASADIAGQVVRDATSIGLRGIRSWSAENLFTDGGLTDGLTDLEETHLFSQYYVDNYAEPRNRISELAFKSMAPTDARAAANWALLCGADISHLIDVVETSPGGGGFNESFFIEGVHYEIQPANKDYADVTLNLDVSPQAYFPTPGPFG